jgi:hypothetical protein
MAEKQGFEDVKFESASLASLNVDPEEERKLVRKLDGRIMVSTVSYADATTILTRTSQVITSLLYLFACASDLCCTV